MPGPAHTPFWEREKIKACQRGGLDAAFCSGTGNRLVLQVRSEGASLQHVQSLQEEASVFVSRGAAREQGNSEKLTLNTS